MPPRLPNAIAAASSHCSSFFTGLVAPRFAAVSLSSSARLAGPRHPPNSSGASFLDLDNNEFGRPRTGPSASHASHAAHPPRHAGAGNNNNDANAALSRVLFDSETRRRMHARREEQKRSALERMAERKVTDDYARHMPRRWSSGELYAPHDLSSVEAHKWKQTSKARTDVADILGFNPLDEYRNFSIISDFMTPMGRIRRRIDTGLRPVNHRRMAKAIRRAIGLGIHPSVHKHPEILASSLANIPKPSYATSGDNRRKAFRV